MPNVGRLGSFALGKENTIGTAVTPTQIVPFIPPLAGFDPTIDLLEAKGVYSRPDVYNKAQQGAGLLKGGKVKFEAEPENGLGEHLMAMFGTDTLTGNGSSTPYSHKFTRASTATPPSYTCWTKNGQNFPQFPGCMLNKLTVSGKAKEFVECEADWVGLSYSAGSTQSLSYSSHNPFKFNQAQMTVGGSIITNYDDFKVEFDNQIEVAHVLGNTIYGQKIYSKGFKVSGSISLIVEDTTEWAKFIAGTSSSLNIDIVSAESISGISPTAFFEFKINIPTIYYKAAPWPLPDGLVKIAFTFDAVYNTGSTETCDVTLVNSKSSSY